MKVGILGSGDVAKALAGGFLKHGHDVTLGTRTPAKLAEWAAKNPKAHIASFADAAKSGELVVLAVKGTAAMEVLRFAGSANFAGKPVIDVTNPIADAPPVNGVLKYYTSLDESQMERLHREFGNARFGLAQFRLVASDQDDGRTELGEHLAARLPDPGPGSRDEDRGAVEFQTSHHGR